MPRPKIYKERRITTAVRIPETMHGRLRVAADERDVSVNLLVLSALDSYLARLSPIDEALQEA